MLLKNYPKAVDDMELIRPYEPNVVKAAWNIFGKSYEYRKKYNDYKNARMMEEKKRKSNIDGQMEMFDLYDLGGGRNENTGSM